MTSGSDETGRSGLRELDLDAATDADLGAAADEMVAEVIQDAMALREGSSVASLSERVARMEILPQEQIACAAQESINGGVSTVTAVARALIDHLIDIKVLDFRLYYASEFQTALGGVLRGIEKTCDCDEMHPDQLNAEEFLRAYLPLGDSLSLCLVQGLLREAILRGEVLRVQSEFVSEKGRHRKERQKLEKMATVDTLTELWNRAAFDARVEEIKREDPEGVYAFLMLDLDKFSKVNNRFGHPAGDEILRYAASVVRRNVRGGKIKEAFRYGGEEVAVLIKLEGGDLSNGASDTAFQRAEQMRVQMPQTEFELVPMPDLTWFGKCVEFVFGEDLRTVFENKLGRVVRQKAAEEKVLEKYSQTVSIGCVVGRGRDLDLMREVADKTLYRAKQTGRNKVMNGGVVE